ncbi:MAG: hypothetical protein ABIH47_03885 [Candidatus Omnitrophota bacterium]
MLKNRRVANKKANQWCVILNPIESELNKTETIEKIVEIFPLSIEEAAQLVERTPIILLENLSYGKAKAVKNLFSSISADILLTDDTFLRRKCYRTVWSDNPFQKLDEIIQKNSVSESSSQDATVTREKLSKESAIKNVREEKSGGTELLQRVTDYELAIKERDAFLEQARGEKKELGREVGQLKKEIYELKHNADLNKKESNEFEYLSLELEKTKELVTKKTDEIKSLKEALQSTDRSQGELTVDERRMKEIRSENENLKILLQDLQHDNEQLRRIQVAYNELKNKYEYLEGEIREFAAERSTFDDLEKRCSTTGNTLKQQEQECKTLRDTVTNQNKEIKQLKNRLNDTLISGDEEKEELREKMKGLKDREETIEQLQTEKHSLSEHVKQLQEELTGRGEAVEKLDDEKEKLKALLQDMQHDNEQLHNVKTQLDTMASKCRYLESESKDFEQTQEQLGDLKAKNDELMRQYKEQKKSYSVEFEKNEELRKKITTMKEEMLSLGEKIDIREGERDKAHDRIQQLEADRETFVEMEKTYNEIREKFALLNADFDKYRDEKERLIREQDTLMAEQDKKIDELDQKCKKLIDHSELQQKTIKELTVRHEEQAAMQKRIKVQQDISQHENTLKGLVKEQEYFESEIVGQESKIKDVLAQQATVEKELVRLKQEQKHLIERAKLKEKQRLPKLSSAHVSIVSPNGISKEKVSS